MTVESLDIFPRLVFLNMSNNKLANFTLIPKVPDEPDESNGSIVSFGTDGSNSSEPSDYTDTPDYSNGSSDLNGSDVTESSENSYTTDDPDYPRDRQFPGYPEDPHRSKDRNPTRSRSPKKSRGKRSMLESTLSPVATTTLIPNVSNGSYFPNENASGCCGDYGTFNQLVDLDLSFNQLRTLPYRIRNLSSLETLWLSGNPFECSCQNVWLRQFIVNGTINVPDQEEVRFQELGHPQVRFQEQELGHHQLRIQEHRNVCQSN